MAVKDVIFEVKLLPKGDTRGIDAVKKKVAEATKAVDAAEKGTEEYTRAQFKLAHANKELSNTMDGVSKRADGLGGRLGSLKTVLAGVFAAGVLKEFAQAGLQSATALENNTIAFETMLGSGEKAKQLLAEIQDFTATTPFQEEEVTKAGKSLLAFNIEADKVVPTLRRIGDISAGIGAPVGEIAEIYGKARVQGRLFAEDINQLTGRGIPIIQELAKQFNVADSEVKKLVEEGKVGFPQLEQAFIGLTSEGGKFQGLTEKLSQSTSGLFSTLKDNVLIKLREGFQKMLPLIKSATSFLIGFFQSINVDKVINFGKVVAVLTSAYVAFRIAVALSSKAISVNLNLSKLITGAKTAWSIAVKFLSGNIRGATTAMKAFNVASKANIIGLITSLIAAAVTAFATFRTELSMKNKLLKEISRTRGEYSAAISEEKVRTNQLFEVAKSELATKEERKRAIDEINMKYGSYLSNLLDEKSTLLDIEAAQKAVNKAIIAQAAVKFKEQEISKIFETFREGQQQVLDDFKSSSVSYKNSADQILQSIIESAEQIVQSGNTGFKPLEEAIRIKDVFKLSNSDTNQVETFIRRLIGEQRELNKQLDSTNKFYGKYEDVLKQLEKTSSSTKTGNELEGASDSIAKLQEELNKAQDKLSKVSTSNTTAINKQLEKVKEAEENLRKAKEAVFGKETIPEEQLLAERERVAIAELQIQGEKQSEIIKEKIKFAQEKLKLFETEGKQETLAYKKLTNEIVLLEKRKNAAVIAEKEKTSKAEFDLDKAKLAEEQRHALAELDITHSTEVKKLELLKEFEERRLALLERNGIKKGLEHKKQTNIIEELEQKLTEAKLQEEERRKQATKDTLNELVNASKNAAALTLEISVAQVDGQINEQNRRIEEARELADKGNADILEAEEKRLDQLQRKREQFVRAQQALAAAELIANSLVAVSKAAAQGGAAAPITIASTLIALAAGLVGARQAAQNAVSFREGGRAEWSKLTGYTGSGNPNTKSTTLGEKPYNYEYEEYIFPKEVVEKGNNRKWFDKIRKGRIDLDKLPMASLRGKHSITPEFNQMIERSIQMDIQMKGGGNNDALLSEIKAMRSELSEVKSEIKNQPSASINVTEKGIEHIVETADFKKTRMKKIR